MGFQEVLDLDCDTTTALGGVNRQTGRPNPLQAEGYYIGTKQTPSRKSKSGFASLHILKTREGTLGVWGKTDLDRKMQSVPVGAMIRVTQNGSVPTPNGDMYKYKVEVDKDNTIEVSSPQPKTTNSPYNIDEVVEEQDIDSEDNAYDSAPVAPSRLPSRTASAPDAARQAKAKALLSGLNKSK